MSLTPAGQAVLTPAERLRQDFADRIEELAIEVGRRPLNSEPGRLLDLACEMTVMLAKSLGPQERDDLIHRVHEAAEHRLVNTNSRQRIGKITNEVRRLIPARCHACGQTLVPRERIDPTAADDKCAGCGQTLPPNRRNPDD